MDVSRLFVYYNTRYISQVADPSSHITTDMDCGSSCAAAILAIEKFGFCPEKISSPLTETVCVPGIQTFSFQYVGWPYIDDGQTFKKQPSPNYIKFLSIQLLNCQKLTILEA